MNTWELVPLGNWAFGQILTPFKIKILFNKIWIYWCSHVIHSFFDGIPQIMDFVVGV